jgi:hypothetical protein
MKVCEQRHPCRRTATVRPSVDILNAAEDGCHSVISFRACSRLAKFIWMIDQFIFNEPQNDSERYQCTAFRALSRDRSLSASHSAASQPCFTALLMPTFDR